jgi:energy-coupling factor transport system ATP-binding protein
MEVYKIKDLSFTYAGSEKESLSQISLNVNQGEFIILCGKSGCGKTTLLRQLKSVLTPYGDTAGEVIFEGQQLKDITLREQAKEIGYVMQHPDHQIVTDKVWHELAFGLENLGYSQQINTFGCITSTAARFISCFCPPESFETSLLYQSLIPR